MNVELRKELVSFNGRNLREPGTGTGNLLTKGLLARSLALGSERVKENSLSLSFIAHIPYLTSRR